MKKLLLVLLILSVVVSCSNQINSQDPLIGSWFSVDGVFKISSNGELYFFKEKLAGVWANKSSKENFDSEIQNYMWTMAVDEYGETKITNMKFTFSSDFNDAEVGELDGEKVHFNRIMNN
jgi:hypothetical protein